MTPAQDPLPPSAPTPSDGAAVFNPTDKVFEAEDGSVVQVAEDYILYGMAGASGARAADKFFFKDLERITVLRSQRRGDITVIRYRVKGKAGDFVIGDFERTEMEEIGNLLELRAKRFPLPFLKQNDTWSDWIAPLLVGLGAVVATASAAGFLYYGWTLREPSGDIVGMRGILIALGCLSLAAAVVAWVGVWRNLRG